MAGGRPLAFETPEELQEAVDAYFDSPPTRTISANGGTVDIPIVTMSGLANHLGFADRQSLYDYEKRKEFSCIIKRARLRVEMEYEGNLHFPGCTGSIFALKNMGWQDKQDLNHTYPQLTPEEVDAKLRDLGVDPDKL